MAIRSMTGYGTGTAAFGRGRAVAELRTVNHRFLDVRVRVPSEMTLLASSLEDMLRKRLDRGRVELSVTIELTDRGEPQLNLERARSAFAAFCQLRDELAPGQAVPLELLSAVPELFTRREPIVKDECEKAIVGAVENACNAVDAMRVAEGKNLEGDMRKRLERLVVHLRAIETRASDVSDGYRTRLRQRIERLLSEANQNVRDERLEQEIILFADRSDISEELTRFESHVTQFMRSLEQTEPTGRKLEFLLQEMAREVNTIGSKAGDLPIAHAVVEMKAEIERLREQVQNIL